MHGQQVALQEQLQHELSGQQLTVQELRDTIKRLEADLEAKTTEATEATEVHWRQHI